MNEKTTLQLTLEVTPLENDMISQAAQKQHLETEDYIKKPFRLWKMLSWR